MRLDLAATRNRLRGLSIDSGSECVFLREGTSFNVVEDVSCTGVQSGFLSWGRNNELRSVVASGVGAFPSDGASLFGSRNIVADAVLANFQDGVTSGVNVGGSASPNEGAHTIQRVRLFNTSQVGFRMDSPNNRLIDVVSLGSAGPAIWFIGQSNVVMNASLVTNGDTVLVGGTAANAIVESVVTDAELGDLLGAVPDAVSTVADASGQALFDVITDWAELEHRHRGWGPSTGAGPCASGDTCQIYDLTPSLAVSPSGVLDRFGLPTAAELVTQTWSATDQTECDVVEPGAWNEQRPLIACSTATPSSPSRSLRGELPFVHDERRSAARRRAGPIRSRAARSGACRACSADWRRAPSSCTRRPLRRACVRSGGRSRPTTTGSSPVSPRTARSTTPTPSARSPSIARPSATASPTRATCTGPEERSAS